MHTSGNFNISLTNIVLNSSRLGKTVDTSQKLFFLTTTKTKTANTVHLLDNEVEFSAGKHDDSQEGGDAAVEDGRKRVL